MPKVLVTGATGFVGQHLQKELKDNGYEVHNTSRFGFNKSMPMNVNDFGQMHSVVNRVKPDVIFHLAAIAFVPSSWKKPNFVLETNALGTLNLLEVVRTAELDPVIHICGSSEEYGLVKQDEIPIKEDNPLRPRSPYAVSKITADFLGYQYNQSYGMKVIRTRAFNHSGYGRGEQYVISTFAKQIAEMEVGKRDHVLLHGDLSAHRDITDVRDVVRAYRLLTEKGDYGEVYNIGTGTAYEIGEFIDGLKKLTKIKFETKLDETRMRPSDVPILQCDATKLKEKTGWKPQYKLEDTLAETLRYWRERVSK